MSNPTKSTGMGRIHSHDEGEAFQVEIDGQSVRAFPGESVAAVLMFAGTRIFTQPSRYNLARALFCGMGLCHQCLVTVDGIPNVRACVTKVHRGMKIVTTITEPESDETG